jgi:hypothetical protein
LKGKELAFTLFGQIKQVTRPEITGLSGLARLFFIHICTVQKTVHNNRKENKNFLFENARDTSRDQ